MFRKEAIFMSMSFVLLIFMGLVAGFFAPKLFRSMSLCKNTIVDQQLSPDETLKAVVFVRDCGATTDFGTHVSILQSSRALTNHGGNLFIADTDHGRAASAPWGGPMVSIHWTSRLSLAVSFDQNARVFKKEDTAFDIKADYMTIGPAANERFEPDTQPRGESPR